MTPRGASPRRALPHPGIPRAPKASTSCASGPPPGAVPTRSTTSSASAPAKATTTHSTSCAPHGPYLLLGNPIDPTASASSTATTSHASRRWPPPEHPRTKPPDVSALWAQELGDRGCNEVGGVDGDAVARIRAELGAGVRVGREHAGRDVFREDVAELAPQDAARARRSRTRTPTGRRRRSSRTWQCRRGAPCRTSR